MSSFAKKFLITVGVAAGTFFAVKALTGKNGQKTRDFVSRIMKKSPLRKSESSDNT